MLSKWMDQIRKVIAPLLPRANYLNRLIWFGCLSVSIPIVLAGSAYYHFSIVKLTNQFKVDNLASLTLLKDRMENVLTSIEHESLKISSNSLIKGTLGTPDFDDYALYASIIDTFQVSKNSSSLISEIMVYDKQSGAVITNNYGFLPYKEYKDHEDIDQILKMEGTGKWAYLPSASREGYLSFVRKLPLMTVDQQAQGVLAIHVKEDILEKNLVNYTFAKEQSLLLLDSNNQIVLHSTDKNNLGQSAERLTGLQDILKDEDSTGETVVLGEDQERYLAVYYKTTYGRTYISLLPERELTKELTWVRWVIFLSVTIFLAFGVLLTFFASKRAYNPIEQLIRYGENIGSGQPLLPKGNDIEYIKSCLSYLNEQSESLNNYLKKVSPNIRDQFLQRLLSGSSISRASLLSECDHHQIPVQGTYVVLVGIIENLFKEKRFLPNEGSIVIFAVTNVMNELLAKSSLNGFIVEKNEREGIAILHFDSEESHERVLEQTRMFAKEIREALRTYLSFSMSVGVGRSYQEITSVAESYREAKLALQHRIFNDSHPVLFFEEMEQTGRQSMFFYPNEQEKVIVEALSRGEIQLAEQALEQFAQIVRGSESYNTIYQCYHVLLSSIIQSLEEKGPGMIDSLEDNWFDQLKARQTSREIYEWFIELIFPLYRQITEESRKKGAKLAIQIVCKQIKENVGVNHSLIEFADLVGLSPSYLSKLFKKELGVSFVEYVMESKVSKAKKLLEDTEYSVMEIAELVGYSERNLNRAFQRYVNMSPKQYRMSHR
ncbi:MULTISPECIES: AraC family transcriptional regulator [unclassified Paenibacillus]|uniref:AraC family transcriptional regulator n=1 Tax=unclassified Paenibacillus TaxID=185978 RepID=UPI00362A639C